MENRYTYYQSRKLVICMSQIRLYSDSKSELIGSENIKNYIFGGRGIVTLEAPSGNSHTYAFYRPANHESFPEDIRFVYAVHNGEKLFYIGMIEQGKFRLTKNSRFLYDTDIVKGARYIMRMANEPGLDTPMKLYHEGMCCFCGRKLISNKSLSTGIGPKCRRRLDGNLKAN